MQMSLILAELADAEPSFGEYMKTAECKEFADVVARVESLRGRIGASQSARQVEGLFESLLAEVFSN